VSDCELSPPSGPIIVPPLAQPGGLFYSLVIPTYNEVENVEPLVQQIAAVLDDRYADRYEIIFADDNSPDGTAEKIKSVHERFPQVKVMVRTNERGLATAVARGWQTAQGMVLGVIDGDLQHPVSVLSEILAKIESGADLVHASRYTKDGGVGKWGLYRQFVSRFSAMLSHLIIPEVTKEVSDPGSGCFALRRSSIEGRVLEPSGYKLLIEVLVRGHFNRIDEVPYTFQLRQHGETKVSAWLFFQYLGHLAKLRLLLWQLNNR
jgi:dolichol-phosphate mannosyltransferase